MLRQPTHFISLIITDHLEASENELIGNEGREKCLGEESGSIRHIWLPLFVVPQVVRLAKADINVINDAVEDSSQLLIPVVILKLEL